MSRGTFYEYTDSVGAHLAASVGSVPNPSTVGESFAGLVNEIQETQILVAKIKEILGIPSGICGASELKQPEGLVDALVLAIGKEQSNMAALRSELQTIATQLERLG